MEKRYITKSKFKLALECPTKLFYLDNPKIYNNTMSSDPFLIALAEGGFQVGALAQCYYADGKLVSTHDKDQALKETKNEILKDDSIVL